MSNIQCSLLFNVAKGYFYNICLQNYFIQITVCLSIFATLHYCLTAIK